MSRPKLILLPCMLALALALPGWATAGSKSRPLNLSLPHDMVQAPSSPRGDDTVERNLHAPASPREGANAPALPPPLPYGAGYEHRHQEFGGAGPSGAGAGAAAGSGGGAGPRGR